MSTSSQVIVLYEDVEAAASTGGLPVETASEIWNDLHQLGFEDTREKHKLQGSQFKRDWETATGKSYDFKKAKDWVPEHYVDKEYSELKKHCEELKALYTKVVNKEKVSGEFLEEQKRLAADLPELLEDLQALANEVKNAETQVKVAEAELEKLEIPTKLSYACPDCNCQFLIQGTKAVKADRKTGSPEEIQLAMHEVSKQQKVVTQAKAYWYGMRDSYERTASDVNAARAAEKRIKEIEAMQLEELPPVEALTTQLHTANLQLDAWVVFNEAQNIQWRIEEKVAILQVLKVLEPTTGEEAVA